MSLKTCTNFGCGRQYREEDNDGRIDPCRHHPSAPFFHDAYKIWQCCGQKSTDFTTFLNCKPCREGKHSDLKRKEEKKKESEEEVEEVAKNGKEDTVEEVEEWDESEWTDWEVKESASVAKHVKSEKIIGEEVVTRRECKRCGRSEEDILLQKTGGEECCYHVGVSIFHDSLKYWSCCPQKKFTEFEEFKKFRGCRVEDNGHEMEAKNLKKEPREDFFQTDQSVTIVLYGVKGARAATTRVKSNGKHVLCVLGDERGGVLWEKEWTLLERIDSREASVLIGSQKVEIAMRKWKKGVRWPQLTQ